MQPQSFRYALMALLISAALVPVASAQEYRQINHPQAPPPLGGTSFNAIDGNTAAGYFFDRYIGATAHGSYLYDLNTGTFTPFDRPGLPPVSTFPNGISGNQITGNYDDPVHPGQMRGFLFDRTTNTFTDIEYPGIPPATQHTHPEDIHDGTIVGWYGISFQRRGFVRSPTGAFTSLHYPNSLLTE